MSIRDLIAVTVSTAEAVRRGVDRGAEGADRRAAAWAAMEKFRATFDPEHVALMEEVIEADFRVSDAKGDKGAEVYAYVERASAMARLEAYRKERNL